MSAATVGAATDRPVVTDERILAAGTTLRFVLLLLLFVAETYSITGDVATHLFDGNRNDPVGCLLAAGGDPDLGSTLGAVPTTGEYPAYQACLHRYVPDTAWAQVVVTGAVVLAAAVLYRLLPLWKARRSRYVPLAHFDSGGDLAIVIAELTRRSRLPATLTLDHCYVDLGAASVSAVVFGTRRHPRIRMNLGLLRIREKNPDRFNAVMLHELAHIANRDVGITYATVAMWRVFLVAVLLPGAVDDVVSLLVDHTPAAWGQRTADNSSLLLEVVIVVSAYLTRADILRTREIYADRTAQSNNAMLDRGGPAVTVRLSVWRTAAGGFAQLWRTHPSWTTRHAALRDPSMLFRPRFAALFIAAFAADVAANALIAGPDGWGLPESLIAVLVVAIVGIAVWRAVLAAVVSRSAPPSGWLIGLWPGLGLAAAELLRNADDGGGWVPEHPEAVLVLVAAAAAVTAWTAQYAELRITAFPCANLRLAMVVGLIAPALALTAILAWWDSVLLLHGWLFGDSQVLAALRLPSRPPWQVAPLPFIRVMPGSEMMFENFIWGLPLLWLIPLVAWGRRSSVVPFARPLGIGALGGALIVGALMATKSYLKPVRVHGGYVVLAAESVWIILVVVAAMAVASALAAGMARGRYPLIQGLLAAGITGVLGLAAVWLQNAADGCLGPFDTGNRRQCGFDAAFPVRTFEPTLGYVLGSGLLVALAVAAAVQAVTSRRRRTRVIAGPTGQRAVVYPTRRYAAIGTAAVVAMGSLIADTVHVSGRPADSASEASMAALLAGEPTPSPRIQVLQAAAWYKYAGSDLTDSYLSAFQRFEDASQELGEATDADTPTIWEKKVLPACGPIYDVDRKAHAYFPVPVAAGQVLWAKTVHQMDNAVVACHTMERSSGDVSVPLLAAYDDTYDAAVALNDTDDWILALTSTQQGETLPDQQGLLGEAQTATGDGNLSYRFTVSHYLVRPDHRTATVQVATCVDKGPAGTRVNLSWAPWYIVLADGTKATPLKKLPQTVLAVPLYPNGNNKPLTVGECVSGLIVFDIPAGATSEAVEVGRKNPDLTWHFPQHGG